MTTFKLIPLVTALSLIAACSSSETCQEVLQEYENVVAAAVTCDPTAPNQCQGMFPVVVVEVENDGTRNLQGLAKNCFGSLNSAVAASMTAAQLVTQYQSMGCKELFVPICQNGDNACIPNPTGGPGYNCFPN